MHDIIKDRYYLKYIPSGQIIFSGISLQDFFTRENVYNIKSNCMNGKGRSIFKYVLSYSSVQNNFKKQFIIL